MGANKKEYPTDKKVLKKIQEQAEQALLLDKCRIKKEKK